MRPDRVARLVLTAGFLFVLAANLPGQMSYDSVRALYQGTHGLSPGFASPLMNALLGLFDKIIPGTALFVTLDALAFFASLIWISRVRTGASWWSVPAALLIVSSPLVVVTQGTVWHDVLFANLAIAGFTCLAWAAREWESPDKHKALLAGVAVLLALATLTRQNGFLCVPVAAVAVWLVARAFGSPKPLRTALAFFLGNLCLLAVAGVLLSVVHANSSYDRGVRLLRTYDIVGVAAIDPHVNLSALDHGNPRVDAMIRREARTFPPQRVDDVALRAPRLWSFLLAQPGSAINAQWWSIVRHDFGYYLRDRLSVFSWTFLTPDITRCLPVFAGIDGNPAWLQSLGLREGERPQDAALVSYSERFFHTPLYSHAFYALIAIVLVFVLALRGDPTDIAVTAMLVSALLVAASYYVVSIACAFRLLYFLDVGALAGLLYFSVDPRLPHSRRRSAADHPPAAPRHAIPDQPTP